MRAFLVIFSVIAALFVAAQQGGVPPLCPTLECEGEGERKDHHRTPRRRRRRRRRAKSDLLRDGLSFACEAFTGIYLWRAVMAKPTTAFVAKPRHA